MSRNIENSRENARPEARMFFCRPKKSRIFVQFRFRGVPLLKTECSPEDEKFRLTRKGQLYYKAYYISH